MEYDTQSIYRYGGRMTQNEMVDIIINIIEYNFKDRLKILNELFGIEMRIYPKIYDQLGKYLGRLGVCIVLDSDNRRYTIKNWILKNFYIDPIKVTKIMIEYM